MKEHSFVKDIDRRSFLSNAGKGLGLMALSSSVVGSLFSSVQAAGKRIEHLSAVEAAIDEDYWATIQRLCSIIYIIWITSNLVPCVKIS